MDRALEGLVVLDLTRVLAGPYASMVLADMGAEVIKIEMPVKGDDARHFGPFIGSESAYFMSINRDKKSITLDLKKDKAKEIFKKMLETADIVMENYRPGTMEKLGLGYDIMKSINPRIIYAACSGFGSTGPYRFKPAYDIIVQGMGGLMEITGHHGGEPTRVGASMGDITAGLFTAIGILTALHAREKSGLGQMIDISMLDCQVAVLENAIARYFVSGEVPVRAGNHHPSITPFDAFPTKKGYIVIAVGNDVLWNKFCNAVKKPELIDDHRFVTNALRTKNRIHLQDVLSKIFMQKSAVQWMDILEQAGIPCGPVNRIDEVVNDPQIISRDMIVEVDHPVAGKLHMPGTPIKLSDTPGKIEMPSPLLGQHTDEILARFLGLNEEEIEQLKNDGIV